LKKRLQLPAAVRRQLVSDMQSYFLEERDEEIGDLAASLLLDFMIARLGPVIYNRGIADCAAWLQDSVDDLYSLQLPADLEDSKF